MSQPELYDVWWTDASEGEQRMEDSHNRHWHKILEYITETDLRDNISLILAAIRDMLSIFFIRSGPLPMEWV